MIKINNFLLVQRIDHAKFSCFLFYKNLNEKQEFYICFATQRN